MRVLITGVTGFVGSHLAEYCLDQGFEVAGTFRWRSRDENLSVVKGRVHLFDADLRDPVGVRKVITEFQPERIFHLAAQSYVHASWFSPAETMTTNIQSQVNLLEAVREAELEDCRIQIAGSSEEYGMVHPDETPIKETNPLRPLSPYAVSKVAQDLMGYQYHQSYGMFIVRTRAFNHSVSRWTPVLIRDDRSGLIDIRYISEIRRFKSAGYLSGKQLDDGTTIWDMSRHETSVWGDGEWTKMLHISAHPLRPGDSVRRLVSSGGIVEVTGDHSVMVPGESGHVTASASSLKVGDKVSLVPLPSSTKMTVHEDVAWFLGFFAAEGCISAGKVRIDNKDRKPLQRCAEILLEHFGMDSRWAEGDRGMWRLIVRKSDEFGKWLGPQIYATDGNKRVPRSVLNASYDAKLAFLRGYNEGDGLKAGNGNYELKSFKTKSPILALGFSLLVANTTGQRMTLNTELREDRVYYQLNLNAPREGESKIGLHLQIPTDVLKKIETVPYEGEVWDFETESHMFHAGLGTNLVHNTGPRRGEVFAESNFAKQIATIEKGKAEPIIRVGNLEAYRDYTDARDICRAYVVALEKCEAGEVYNIGSGEAWRIGDMLDALLDYSTVKVKIQEDPERMRPSDVPRLEADWSKFKAATGWAPTIPFEQTLKDTLDYWRERV